MVSEKISSGVRTVEVSRDRDGQRIDNFLAGKLQGLPRSIIYRIIRTGQVRVNGGRVKPSRRLAQGDRVRIPPVHLKEAHTATVPDGVLDQVRAAIIHETGELLVLDKPAGLAVHGGSGVRWGVIDAVRQLRPNMAFELAHRLDRETSGCLLFARNADVLRRLHEQFRNNATVKRYFCLMDGRLPEDKVIVDARLSKSGRSGERFMVAGDKGQSARTEFRLLEHYSGYSFVEAMPYTGRTHQIRAHAVFLGLPLAGDERYASRDSVKRWKDRGLNRLFLHAHSLTVLDTGGDPLQFTCRLPGELSSVLDGL